MLFELQQFENELQKPASWSEHVFMYCDFSNINTEGTIIDSLFQGCRFNNCDWYWGLFNSTVFVEVKFEKCKFRGSSFAGCKFVECEFLDCEFAIDSFNEKCTFDKTVWYDCKKERCKDIAGEFNNKF